MICSQETRTKERGHSGGEEVTEEDAVEWLTYISLRKCSSTKGVYPICQEIVVSKL
jgi:hypothetical protein